MAVASDPAMTKRCYDCGLVKPIDEFAFHNKAKGTRQARCRHVFFQMGNPERAGDRQDDPAPVQ